MGRPQGCIRQPPSKTDNYNGEILVAKIYPDLLETACYVKCSKCINKRAHTTDRKAGGHAYHVSLCDTAIDKPAGKFFLVIIKHLISDIPRKNNDSVIR